MSVTSGIHLLLLCLCFQNKIQPARCKPKWMKPQFPCDVTAKNDSTVLFNCRRRHLKDIPDGITGNASELLLSENWIENITHYSFSKLVNLTELDLSWANSGKTLTIDRDAFKHLTKLYHLSLTGNHLRKIPCIMPSSVEILNLKFNKIVVSLDKDSFVALAHVTDLQLSKNCYSGNPCGKNNTIIDDSLALMHKLQSLDLAFNNLTHVPKGLPKSLQILALSSNIIQSISEYDFFGLANLGILKLSGNCPRCENAPYPCVPCPNISLRIHPKAFHSLTELETLNLGGNSLDHMKSSWFEKLNKLKRLYLAFNFLMKAVTTEATFLRHLPNLETLDISFNFALKSFAPTINLSNAFLNLTSLRTLHMEGLVFQGIGQHTLKPLYQLKNLSVLNLATNFIFHSDSTIFQKFSNLKMIFLAENRLYPISVESPQNPLEGYKHRSDTSISTVTEKHLKDRSYEVPNILVKPECFDSGRVLVLSSNNLFFITPKQFAGYGNIACLNLSGNGFSAALNGTEFSILPNLTYLDLSFNKIDLAYSHAFRELKKLEVLDISHNSHYFQAFGVTHNLNFTRNLPVLRVLNMSYNLISTLTTKKMYSNSLAELQFTHNHLGKLWEASDYSYEKIFYNLYNLTILDISHNRIQKIPDRVYRFLPLKLTLLCISYNKLTDFAWDNLRFFHQLQILDLSYNSLTNVIINTNVTNTLNFLDLTNNLIFHLDNGFLNGAKSLHTLSLSMNQLTTINQTTFLPGLENPIKTLYLQRNPFQCTCDSLDFILWIDNSNVKIPRLTTHITCDTPKERKGHPLIYFDINQCVNDNEAFLVYILTYCFILFFLIVTTVAHLFYWDASYVLHYMKAKLKGYSSLNPPDSVYDVFVTYDTGDPHVSEWVMRDLRVKLEEEGDKNLPLCLEERDWPPGVPMVDNLTQSIRYSRKTLFVLTEGYVKSGAFKLAMYLAHQRLLDENMDVIVLLMLEPVLQNSHFLRLRKRLCGQSVVEWPRMSAAEPWFWQNLRNVVRVDNQFLYNKTYSKYFSNN